MVAKKRTQRLDKSVKRTVKAAGSDGRKRAQLYKEKFSIIVLLSIEKRGWQYSADLRQR